MARGTSSDAGFGLEVAGTGGGAPWGSAVGDGAGGAPAGGGAEELGFGWLDRRELGLAGGDVAGRCGRGRYRSGGAGSGNGGWRRELRSSG